MKDRLKSLAQRVERIFSSHPLDRKQKIEAANFFAGWLDKVSVGCLVVGLFQPQHMAGGMVGSIVCFAVALGIKIRSAQ